jgi:hypothetical protein
MQLVLMVSVNAKGVPHNRRPGDSPGLPIADGMAGMGVFFLDFSATIASVVIRRPAIEAASCNAVRTTLVTTTNEPSSLALHGNILQHRVAAITKPRSLDGRHFEPAAQLGADSFFS